MLGFLEMGADSDLEQDRHAGLEATLAEQQSSRPTLAQHLRHEPL